MALLVQILTIAFFISGTHCLSNAFNHTKPVSHQLSRKRRSFSLTSLRCNDNHNVDPGVGRVLETRMNEVERGGDPLIRVIRPNQNTNPVVRSITRRIGRGLVNNQHQDIYRVELVEARFEGRHVNPRNRREFPAWTLNYLRDSLGGRPGDVRFHLVPNELSGPPELYNMVPGHQSINNNVGVPHNRRTNDWRSVERAMRDHVSQNNGNYVRWFVGMHYENNTTGRPSHFVYAALMYNRANALTMVICNSVRNVQN